MQSDHLTKGLLLLIAGLLSANLIRSLVNAPPVRAQPPAEYNVYIEPGVRMLRAPDGSRQVLGKVFIDLANGNVWGYPTTVDQPYPVDVMNSKPPTSKPFLLGRFDLTGMNAH
jgi:hypothetical protein